jgi:hypothetical protein
LSATNPPIAPGHAQRGFGVLLDWATDMEQ